MQSGAHHGMHHGMHHAVHLRCSARYAVQITAQVSVAFAVLLGEHAYGDDDPEFGSPLAIPWFAIYGCARRPISKIYFACLLSHNDYTTRYINSTEILTSSPALNIYVTVLLWVYMFVVQIGMLNLLIAIMTDTYFKVISRPACPTFPPAAFSPPVLSVSSASHAGGAWLIALGVAHVARGY